MLRTTPLRLIGYVRLGDSLTSEVEQMNAIRDYCRANKHRVVAMFTDPGRRALGFAQAIEGLKRADGLITYDVMRLVENSGDSLRELRPLVETVFMHGHKKLITIAEGFENITPIGQENIMAMLSDWNRREAVQTATCDKDTHEFFAANQML